MILSVVLGFAAATIFVVIFLGSHYGMSLGRYMHRQKKIPKNEPQALYASAKRDT